MKHPLWTTLALLALARAASAADFLPSADAVALALDERAEVLAAGDRVDRARAQARQTAVGPNEAQLSVIGQQRRVEPGSERFDELEVQFGRAVRINGKAGLDRALARSLIEQADVDALHSRREASLRLLDDWMAWLRASTAADVARQQHADTQRAREAVARREQRGDAARLDLDQMDAELARAALALLEAEGEAELARSALQSDFPRLPLPARVPPLPEPLPFDGDVTDWQTRLVEHDFRQQASRALASQAAILADRARADRLPDPTLGIRYLDERGGLERSLGFVVSVPIGREARAAAADAARADANARRREADASRREAQSAAHRALQSARLAVARWRALLNASTALESAATRMSRAFELGEASVTELLVAQREARSASLAERRARSEALQARAIVEIGANALWAVGDSGFPQRTASSPIAGGAP